MAISDNDPRLRDIIAAAKIALEKQDGMARHNDPTTAYETAGNILHAVSAIVGHFQPAIAERFHDDLPRDTTKNHPDIAKMFQRSMARVWEDVMAAHVPRGQMLTHGLYRLSEGDQPELLTRAPPDEGRHSSKPMSSDMEHAKRMIVLRAYYDASLHQRTASDVLAQYRGLPLTYDRRGQERYWIDTVPGKDRRLAAAAGKATRAGVTLTEEQETMRQQVLRLSPQQLLDAYMNLGGTPR
jgi:hypothetical protein